MGRHIKPIAEAFKWYDRTLTTEKAETLAAEYLSQRKARIITRDDKQLMFEDWLNNSGQSIATVAKRHGMNETTLSNMITEHFKNKLLTKH